MVSRSRNVTVLSDKVSWSTVIPNGVPASSCLLYLFPIDPPESKKQEIPEEIDDHLKLFGKEPWEIEYGDKCPLCNSRFDEFEGCACDSKGD